MMVKRKVSEDILSGIEKLEASLPKMPIAIKEKFVKIAVTKPELMKLQEEGRLVGWDGKGIATIRKE